MFYTIYQITNKINHKKYIGLHKTEDLNDGYMGSGTYIKRAIAKHGVDNFIKRYLFIFDNKEDMFEKESELVDINIVESEEFYNLKLGGFGGWDFINENNLNSNIKKINELKLNNSAEQYKKGSAKHSFLMQTNPSYKENWLKRQKEAIINRKGHPQSDESKRKIGLANSVKQKGNNNSNFGNIWVYNPNEKISKCVSKIEVEEFLRLGWLKGRKIKFD